ASDNKFWQFSLDELAKFDAPAVIDKALNVSGQKSLYWLGHSQGSAIGFMMLSERPEYNRKLRALFQLGPAGTYGYAKGLMRFVLMAYKTLKPITDFYRFILGSHEIVMGEASVNRPLITLCEEKIPFLGHEECNNGIRSLFGSPAKEINSSRLPESFNSPGPCGTSSWIFQHWGQMASRRKVEHMDHNPLENFFRYGQETPPPYNYRRRACLSFLE
ncbi:hypothetical protein PENTCL1PPCAC_3265, partial [Pristionchus entomophagus]